jgi:hypothetical protein
MRDVYATVYAFPVAFWTDQDADRQRNIILIGTSQTRISSNEVLASARAFVAGRTVIVDGFLDAAMDIYDGDIPTADVPVLTDNFAPVDSLAGPR